MNTFIPLDVMPHHGGGPGFIGILGVVILATLIGLVIYLALRNHKLKTDAAPSPVTQAPRPTPEMSALGILAERLARGDISVEEYQGRAAALRPDAAPPQ